MSQPHQILNELQDDARKNVKVVIYLEGQSDVPMFFGLLGVPLPTGSPRYGYLHEDVLVRGLFSREGSGAGAVRTRVEIASQHPQLKVRFVGVVDGDGRERAELRHTFEAPWSGPMYTWPAYCLENLLVQAGWPVAWGSSPDWSQVALEYAPYVALARVWRDITSRLDRLDLRGFPRPDHSRPLRSVAELMDLFAREKGELIGYDVERRFLSEVQSFKELFRGDLADVHSALDGKWLVTRVATSRKESLQECRDTWALEIGRQGGMSLVQDLWSRCTAATGAPATR